ncbi:hypothetical protein FisN_11Hh256 [Fistulifera solaris]|jgi:hypothetical protein|uniref:Uncharacterized protein n=1 Tax=Fistulifera solaris TaxID=1519565 RepID=A0A1Z5JL19_FISSO|nr:hypothetical protein FisN_11Hh256 [Fistulifera solaris]|eukprot:GAX14715.1 hypothetical protein FisN_11Hh256 [Fistulifera solaris]
MDQSEPTERIGNDPSMTENSAKLPPTTEPTSQTMMRDILPERLLEFQFQNHSLRISASNVAAMAGYHPYKNLPELLLQLVYQGRWGAALLQKDAQLLGLTMITPQEALNELAKKAGVDKTLKKVLQTVKKGKVTTIETAHALKSTLTSQEVKKHLSPSEWEQFREGVRSAVDTNYGVVHENAALDEYQKLCGWPVSERNAAIRSWAFARSEDFPDEPDKGELKTAVPIKEAESLPGRPTEHGDCDRPPNNKKQKTVIDLTNVSEAVDSKCTDARASIPSVRSDDEQDSLSSASCISLKDDSSAREKNDLIEIEEFVKVQSELTTDTKKEVLKSIGRTVTVEEVENKVIPYFYILGSVDGIRDELTSSFEVDVTADVNDDDSWSIRSIIVECKHRMRRLHSPPPLYEQIQASIYCLMYGVNDADIVQVLRQDSKSNDKQSNDKLQSTIKSFIKTDGMEDYTNDEKVSKPEQEKGKPQILVSRVSLDDPALQHKTNWTTIVLPRLRAFVDAVYSIRSSDDLRYRLLASSSESELGSVAAWEFLHEQCPWLTQCDTAFSRVKQSSA